MKIYKNHYVTNNLFSNLMILFKNKTFQSKQIKATQNIFHLVQTVSDNLAMARP